MKIVYQKMGPEKDSSSLFSVSIRTAKCYHFSEHIELISVNANVNVQMIYYVF